MRRKVLCSSSILFMVFAAAYGCEGSNAVDAGSGAVQSTASVTFAQLANFSGNSVTICGARSPEADPKYPCENVVPCTCFNFNGDGTLQDGTIEGLCPSTNIPQGDWMFSFSLWSEPDCKGEILNAAGNPNNFECFDVSDMASRDTPNLSFEPLEPGENINHIFCTSKGAEKEWKFYSCLELDTHSRKKSAFDCSCEKVDYECACGSLTEEDLPDECRFDDDCNILCGAYPPPPPPPHPPKHH